MTEIQGKSIFVRVSARFELPRVRFIGSRLYFHGKIETTESLQKLPMVPPAWNRDISPLPLNDQSLLKQGLRFLLLLVCFVLFSFGWPEPVKGRQCEETFQKSSWSQKKNFSRLGRLLFLIFKLVSSTLWPFCCCCCCCFTSSMLHLEVSRLKIVKH